MKTTNLFKTVAFVAMTIVSVMNTEVKVQENNFITNEEVKNDKLYNQDASKSELPLVSYNKTDYVANILAMAE